MARNEIDIDSPIDDVFRTLIRAETFGYWVVGAKEVRGVDDDWPAPGARFHHSVGVGPVHIEDVTELRELDPPKRLVMRALIGPLGSAIVRLLLQPAGVGTHVVMEEETESGVIHALPSALVDALAELRNAGALQRLRRLVEGDEHADQLDHRSPLSRAVPAGRLAPLSVVALAAGGLVLGAVAVRARRRDRRRSRQDAASDQT